MKGVLVCFLLVLTPCAAMASDGAPSTSAFTVTATQYPPTREIARHESGDENPRYRTRWSVSLDTAGRVTRLEPSDGTLVDAVRLPLDKAIRSWQFIPGSIGGQPAATDTTLALDITLVPSGDDKFALRVDDARTGGGIPIRGIRAAPKYPREAIYQRRQGMVVLKVDYDAAGHVVATKPLEGAPAVAADLTRAAEQAIKSWSFSPEIVGGHPLAGSVVVPTCFEIVHSGSMPQSSCEWIPPGAHRGLHDNDVLAIEPAAKLQTDVIGHTL